MGLLTGHAPRHGEIDKESFGTIENPLCFLGLIVVWRYIYLTHLSELICGRIFFNANKDLDTSKACLRAVHKGVSQLNIIYTFPVICNVSQNFDCVAPYAQHFRKLRQDVLPNPFVMHFRKMRSSIV
jgi:hypothetical protein